MTFCWVGVHRASCVNIFFSKPTGTILTKFGMQHLYCKRQDIENFMTFTPSGGNFRVKNLKLMYFFKNDPRGRSSCARARPYTSYSENALFALILYKSTSLLLGIDQINQVCMMMTK